MSAFIFIIIKITNYNYSEKFRVFNIIFLKNCLLSDIRRSNRSFVEDKTEDDYFQIDVRVFFFFMNNFIFSGFGFLIKEYIWNWKNCRLGFAVGSQ
jgi:hypothetical protein